MAKIGKAVPGGGPDLDWDRGLPGCGLGLSKSKRLGEAAGLGKESTGRRGGLSETQPCWVRSI